MDLFESVAQRFMEMAPKTQGWLLSPEFDTLVSNINRLPLVISEELLQHYMSEVGFYIEENCPKHRLYLIALQHCIDRLKIRARDRADVSQLNKLEQLIPNKGSAPMPSSLGEVSYGCYRAACYSKSIKPVKFTETDEAWKHIGKIGVQSC